MGIHTELDKANTTPDADATLTAATTKTADEGQDLNLHRYCFCESDAYMPLQEHFLVWVYAQNWRKQWHTNRVSRYIMFAQVWQFLHDNDAFAFSSTSLVWVYTEQKKATPHQLLMRVKIFVSIGMVRIIASAS